MVLPWQGDMIHVMHGFVEDAGLPASILRGGRINLRGERVLHAMNSWSPGKSIVQLAIDVFAFEMLDRISVYMLCCTILCRRRRWVQRRIRTLHMRSALSIGHCIACAYIRLD